MSEPQTAYVPVDQIGIRRRDGANNRAVDGFSGEGPVQIDQMQASRPRAHPAAGHLYRIVGEYGFIVHASLAQAHAAPVFQIDGGYQ